MISLLMNALFPILITLLLGYFAGWHQNFQASDAGILNRMVMLYALPLNLFMGIMSTSKTVILNDQTLLLWIFIGMIGSYFIVFSISHFLFKRNLDEAALQALAISGPAVPFVGMYVLGTLFKSESSIDIAICSLFMNLIQVPITLILLSYSSQQTQKQNFLQIFKKNILNILKEPLVWAPLSAFVLVIFNFKVPLQFHDSFTLLGNVTGGVALFASGIILYSQKVSFSLPVIINVISKNILLPLIMWIGAIILKVDTNLQSLIVLTLAIPTASIVVILSVQYKKLEKEMSSTLFFSTIFSIITMGIFIYLIKF